MYRLLLLLLTLSLSSSPMAATRFTLLSPENEQDARMDYYREAMRLALEKTRQQYGDYELRDSLKMNKARMRLEVQKPGKSALFIVDSWPQKTPHPEVSLIPFPIDLGILGYRVCFVGAELADALAGVRTLAQLQAFSQGSGRVDLFCRGANEILAEWETHHPRLPTLTVDPHVALFYPLIHAFYSHATYHKERDRIQLGLRLAWQDGSLKRLWRQHFQPSLAFTQLASRQLFRLSNPQLPGEGSDYSSYLYDPARDAFGMPPHDKADRVGK